MNYLQLVQKAVRKSGAKVSVPSTVVGQTGIELLFVEWVQEAWKDIQMERLGVSWRMSRDLTFNTVAGTDEYGIDATLESVNTRTFTAHLAGANESPVCFRSYDYWRTQVDRVTMTQAKPQYFTISHVDDNLIFWPVPDAAYTIRYEGIRAVQEFDYEDTAGAGTSDILTPTNLNSAYHDAIVWQAVINYAMHFEDGNKLQEATTKFRPYKKYFEERYMPLVNVDTSALYSRNG